MSTKVFTYGVNSFIVMDMMFTYKVNAFIVFIMEIFFSKGDLQKLCESSRMMERRLGTACANKLKRRLADLQAAVTLKHVTAGRPHPLERDRQGQFALCLHGACRLVFESTDEPIPYNKDGTIAWNEVTKVRIVFIGDYHD